MDILKLLLKDSRFYGALLLLINAVLYFFVPDFPEKIWAAFNGVAAIIIGVLATNGSRTQVRAARELAVHKAAYIESIAAEPTKAQE